MNRVQKDAELLSRVKELEKRVRKLEEEKSKLPKIKREQKPDSESK